MSGQATTHNNFGGRIIRDRQIWGGEPVFKGTRVLLRTVLASLAAGDAAEDILQDFPTLKAEDVRAAIAFAAASAEEDLPARPFQRSMKAKLDENLPLRIAARLRELGRDVHTAEQENLSGCGDSELWTQAQRESRTLITQDLDFSDSRRFTPGTHHGLVLVLSRAPSRMRLIQRLQEVFQTEAVDEWPGCFVVVTDQKIRVRRKPIQS
jgi:uncharacterized protein (DUF433 family)/predicted nuclease of predicted toxin-antitoxin system